jgi:hypothetical protein
MTINYNLFATTTGTGKSFKFIFKATNCEDYNAKVLEAYDKEDKRGLTMQAQLASFDTSL